jgi:hypothetical protein
VKFSPIQGDFSAGELTERLWGQTLSDAYKAGLALAANVLPMQQGSAASRAGARLISDHGHLAPAASGSGTVMLPLQDSPLGDAQLEVETNGNVRFKNRWGVIPWKWNQDLAPFFDTHKVGGDIWTDPAERKLYIRNWDTGVGTPDRHVDIQCDTAALGTTVGGRTARLSFFVAGGFAAGVNGTTGIAAGVIVEQYNAGVLVGAVAADVGGNSPGWWSGHFQPLLGTTIRIRHRTFADIGVQPGYNQVAFDIWGMRLCGDWDGGEALTLNVPGLVGSLGMRYTTFWTDTGPVLPAGAGPQRVYIVSLTGPGMRLKLLQWSPTTAFTPGWVSVTPIIEGAWLDPANANKWVFGDVQGAPWLQDGTIGPLIAYQGRLWLGLTDSNASLKATSVNYGDFFQFYGLSLGRTIAPRLQFARGRVEPYQVAAGGQVDFPFINRPVITADVVRVFKNNVELALTTDFTITLNTDQVRQPGGKITLTAGAAGGDIIIVWTYSSVPGAADAIDVSLAQPTGKFSWLADLRGLVLGAGRGELVFTSGVLAIDPVNGSSFDIEKHGSYGSAALIQAVGVADKIAFVLPGRKRIRLMGKSFNTFGGLLAQDLSLVGEHLLKKGVRSMTFLRSPVPRFVFGFDDGTGAIATFNDDKNTLAWARLSLPAPYDIYCVSALDTSDYGPELWVTSSNGASFVFTDLESQSQPRVRKVVTSVAPAGQPADDIEQFDEGLAPVMDSWMRVPLNETIQFYYELPKAWIGHNLAVIAPDGTYKGTFPAVVDIATGHGGSMVDFGEDVAHRGGAYQQVTYLDINGKLQPAYYTVGVLYADHRMKLLPLEGGNPVGTAQAHMSRGVQRYIRFVDSYMPLVNGKRVPERVESGPTDIISARITGDRRVTEEGWNRASQPEILMDLPFRFEVAAIFGGTMMQSV